MVREETMTPRLAILGLLAAAALAQSASAAEPFRDPSLSAEVRAADLVSRMTLEEKAGQLRDIAPAIPRLGVPRYNWWSEGLHGVARAGEATVFPQAVGMAATWDTPLIHDVADVIATEFRAKYVQKVGADGGSDKYRGLTVWSPNINIFRDPRWGRGQETYGEDPYLTSRLGVAFIHGLQGDDPKIFKTIATAKHFAVHSGPEAGRHRDDIHPSAYDLEDTYLPAFRATVIEGNAQAVMCAYNAVDGVPACANRPLLVEKLRGDWGFKGHVVSDCAAVSDFFRPDAHLYVKTPEDAVAVGIKAGMDVICGEFGPGKSTDSQPIVTAVRDGRLLEAEVDQAARRLFEARLRLGLFDPPGSNAYARIPASENDTPAHRALALDTAKASLVLLKNNGLLPLKTAPRTIAVIGPNADSLDALVGNYNGTPSKPVTVLAGLKARFPQARVTFVEGSGPVGSPMAKTPDAAFCVDAACAAKGLKVETYQGLSLQGPAEISADKAVQFSWGRPERKARETSIRWSGYITSTETGVHRFRLATDAGYRLYVDGKLILDAWGAAAPTAAQEGVVELRAGQPRAIVVEAIQKADRGDQRLNWSLPSQGVEAALAAARDADLVVFAGGLTARLEGEEMQVHADGFVGGDRTSLDLPKPQESLLEKLHATGKPVVLVLMNGSAMSVNWADKALPAIVEAWYPGGEGGQAIASLIAGDFSPSGRLPVTFYRSAAQLPGFTDYTMTGRTYRYFKGEALYPFGYGLSYTRFAYGPAKIARAKLAAGEEAVVTVSVKNNGDRDGAEVVQLYVSRPGAGPIRALQGFQRIALKKGESREVRFVLDARALSVVDATGKRHVEPGRVDLWVGGGQPGAREGLVKASGVSGSLEVAGRKALEP
jgi:beta-glucosidase